MFPRPSKRNPFHWIRLASFLLLATRKALRPPQRLWAAAAARKQIGQYNTEQARAVVDSKYSASFGEPNPVHACIQATRALKGTCRRRRDVARYWGFQYFHRRLHKIAYRG